MKIITKAIQINANASMPEEKYENMQVSYDDSKNIIVRFWSDSKNVCKNCKLPIEELKTDTGMNWYHKNKYKDHKRVIAGNKYCKMMEDELVLDDDKPMILWLQAEPLKNGMTEKLIIFDENESNILLDFITSIGITKRRA